MELALIVHCLLCWLVIAPAVTRYQVRQINKIRPLDGGDMGCVLFYWMTSPVLMPFDAFLWVMDVGLRRLLFGKGAR